MSGSSNSAVTSVESGTGIGIPESSVTMNHIATYRCSKSSTSCPARSSPTDRRSTNTARTSASISASTIRRSSPPRSKSCTGSRRPTAGASRPTEATISGPGSWSWPQGRFTGPSCQGSPVSRTSKATVSTPRAGTTPTPAVTAPAGWTNSPTNVSLSSAPERPVCRWCRSSVVTRSTCMSFSEPPRQSTLATTHRPIRNG